jgi:hypothetical protein
MKLQVLAAAIAALALAGPVSAQPEGYAPSQMSPLGGGGGLPYVSTAQRAADRQARAEFQRSCAPDRVRLCGDKSSKVMGSCLEYHRLKLSAPCRQAVDKMELARRGAL